MDTSFAILRNRTASTAEFRRAADAVCGHLMREMKEDLAQKGIDQKDIRRKFRI